MITRRQLTMLLPVALLAAGRSHPAPSPQRVVANDNRRPAGRMEHDTLVLRLTVTPASWHILGEDEPAFTVLAFAEDGKPPTIPGPLIRVRVGTPVHVWLHNPLDDTLILRGLGEGVAIRDSMLVLPGETADVRFVARNEGNYMYWAVTGSLHALNNVRSTRRGYDSQLGGAIVVDPLGTAPDDRVFVITELADRELPMAASGSRDRHGTPVRQYNAVNGKAWPHTERLQYALGDSVRWRLVNVSPEPHPMHLHGFYFRVDSRGTWQAAADSIYAPEQRRMVVTEVIASRNTASIVWSPERPGGWLFHCHLTNHVAKFPRIGQRSDVEYPSTHHEGNADKHAFTGMNGLILGITVTGRAPASVAWQPARRLRLFVQSDSGPGDRDRRFGYVLQRGAEPSPDSIEYPGPVLVLTRGEPTSVEVVNRSNEPTTVHWHGIELESYYDGVAGWSGTANRPAPAVRSGRSFEVRLTPARAGTFMYHTHLDELRQQYGGLVGPLVVLEPGEHWDPEHDLIFLLSDGIPQRLFINGALDPQPKDLEVGTTYRLRIAHIAVFRLAAAVRLIRDSALTAWRPIAKDGFTLPHSQATVRPSIANMLPGETADFEFTPDQPGDILLVVGPTNRAPEATVRLRVSRPQ